jgi:hypothetical protein
MRVYHCCVKKEPNHPASGNGAISALFYVGRQRRAVPDPAR